MNNFFVLILFGYLLGSISPGYFFGRIVKGIDIRDFGNHLTGATNTFRVVGKRYGLIAGAIDVLKGAVAYLVAVFGFEPIGLLAVSPDLAILVGLAAVLGHNYPFYLGFRGGRGAATLFGLTATAILHFRSIWTLLLFIGSVIYSLLITEEKRLFIGPRGRTLFKLSALILPLWFMYSSVTVISLIRVLFFVSLIFDLSRFLSARLNQWYLGLKKFSKEKELRTFSGYTLFLLSAFLVFFFFPKEIAVISLTNFILGDVFAPSSRIRHLPQQRILGDKTWGGAIMIFGISLIAGLFLRSLSPLTFPLAMIFGAAFLAAILDQLSVFVDDNILVPLGTAIGLTFLI